MKVAVIMGSSSDWNVMKEACAMLEEFNIPYDQKVVSAHRTPHMMVDFATNARSNGYHVVIAEQGSRAFTRNGGFDDNTPCHRCTD